MRTSAIIGRLLNHGAFLIRAMVNLAPDQKKEEHAEDKVEPGKTDEREDDVAVADDLL